MFNIQLLVCSHFSKSQNATSFRQSTVLRTFSQFIHKGSQMAERIGNRATHQTVASLIPDCAKLCCVL